MSRREARLVALSGVPRIAAGDDLATLVLAALDASGERLADGDVLVLAQKIVSKAEGRRVALAEVAPSERALVLAAETGKDARLVELILRESSEVMRTRAQLIVVAHRLGVVLANAGIDRSNVEVDGDEAVLLWPIDPDASAARLRDSLRAGAGADVAVVIADSIGRAWRMGTIGTAIGVAGLPALLDLRGRPDMNARPLETTEVGLADEVAAAASLLMGQADEGTPVVLVRGVPYARGEGAARDLVRPKDRDMFR